jgi:hypothetical protein
LEAPNQHIEQTSRAGMMRPVGAAMARSSCAEHRAYRDVREMVRRGLAIVFVAVALGVLPFLATACGEGKAVAQPSFSYATPPRLLDIGDFSLLGGRPTRVMLRATSSHPLTIFILAERPLDAVTLRRVAAADGSQVTHKVVPVQGDPHASGQQTVYGLTAEPIEPGYYRLDLLGHGRIESLAVRDW